VALAICGIDPGLTTSGLVIIQAPNHVVYGRSLAPTKAEQEQVSVRAKALGTDTEFNRGVLLASSQAQRILQALDEAPVRPDMIAVESFVDQPQHAKTMRKGLWKTPLTIGYLLAGLAERGYDLDRGTLHLQNAGVVLKHMALRIEQIKRRDETTLNTFYPGSAIVTNSHMRSAFAHAAWRVQRIPRKDM
jgi:hypothetical protein